MDWQVRLKSGIPFQRLTSLSDTASRARYLPWHMCEERGCQAMQKALGLRRPRYQYRSVRTCARMLEENGSSRAGR